MRKGSLTFWILFVVSIAISATIISVFVKVLKVVLFIILVLALTPVVYILLKLILPGKKTGNSDKLKTRD